MSCCHLPSELQGGGLDCRWFSGQAAQGPDLKANSKLFFLFFSLSNSGYDAKRRKQSARLGRHQGRRGGAEPAKCRVGTAFVFPPNVYAASSRTPRETQDEPSGILGKYNVVPGSRTLASLEKARGGRF